MKPLILSIIAALILILGFRVAKNKVIHTLSNTITLESGVEIIPQDFRAKFPFKLSWKSVKIVIDSTELTFENPKITIDPFLDFRHELLNISTDKINAKIVLKDSTEQEPSSLEFISHPDLWLPFRVGINVNRANIDVKDVGKWSLDSLSIRKSGRQKRIRIKASDIKGTHIARSIFLNAEYRWNAIFSDASVSVFDKTRDSISVALNAPREHLEDLSAEVNANIADLQSWLKEIMPEEVPSIKHISLQSNASINALTTKADFNLYLKSRIGEFWQLPAFNAEITLFGNNSGISQSEISLLGDKGESVIFRGNVSKNLDGMGELETNGIKITLGPETMYTDAKFHQIIKKGNFVHTKFTTGAGSNFTASILDLTNPEVVFTADLAPKEPWAVQWTDDMVELANPTILTGKFNFETTILTANLKTKVPFAYYASADLLDVSLWLDPEGIRFPKGEITRNGYKSNFTGEVMWDKEYFTFKLNQPSGGTAEVFGTFNPKLELMLSNVNTIQLPFADTSMLKGYSGIVNAHWNHDFEKSDGKLSASLFSSIKNHDVSAETNIEFKKDSLKVKSFELEQNNKKIEAFLYALLPGERRSRFEIQRAGLKIPNMNLVNILAMFRDSTLERGFVDGSLEYNRGKGLTGEVELSKVLVRNLDENIVNFSNLRLQTFGQSAKASTHIFLPDSLWNGDLEVGIENIGQGEDLPVFVLYKADNIDNIGNLKLNGMLSRNLKNISGNIQIYGDWFLPGIVAEIKKSAIGIAFKTELSENILDSLSASFSTGKNTFKYEFLEIPFAFSGHIKNAALSVDSAFIYGQKEEKVEAQMLFDLKNATMKNLSFNTEEFTLSLLDQHRIKIKNGNGKSNFDSTGITFFAELPSISYNMKSTDYGEANATLKGQAIYHFPFQTKQSQTNPSITGNFEINNASYKNTIDLMPDPLHLDRTLKSIGKFWDSLIKEKRSASERRAVTGRPISLNVKIQTTGVETATVNSNVAEFGFTVNVTALGTTRNPLLSGDINAVGDGEIGYRGLTMFDLSMFRLYWLDSPIKQGEIDLRASHEYPFCVVPEDSQEENCTININMSGPLAQLNMEPTANCNIEASPALIYYSMLLGCISTDTESENSFDKNKMAGKLIGKLMSSTINRGVGSDLVGDIDVKYMFDKQNTQEYDTSYIRIPIKITKNLDAVIGYTQDESRNPRYIESREVGLRYKLPVFDSTDISSNLIEPSLNINSNLISRDVLSTTTETGSGEDETRLEKNVGLSYSHKFWEPCILGLGYCRIGKK